MIRRIFFLILLVSIITLVIFIWKNLTIPKSSREFYGQLQPCPKTPNCVNSQVIDREHFIEPLIYRSSEPLNQIENFLKRNYIAKVIKKTPTYLHVVITTKILRFKDDLEFLYFPELDKIEVRSASRVGYSDMGLNRSRIEKLRKYLQHRDIHS